MSPKPQTTRHPIRGILHDSRGQIVFVDTPGVFLGKKDAVSGKLNELVKQSLEGIDAVIYVVDPTRPYGKEEEHIQNMLKNINTPIILAVNKKDLPDHAKPALQEARMIDVGQEGSVEISAKTHANLNLVINKIFELLPEGDAMYPEEQMTDLSHEDWLAELIREKCFLALDQELPYSVAVQIEEVSEKGTTKKIEATIFTSEERYKGMIIGKGGLMLKSIGMAARKELEMVTGGKVFLDLHVKTDPKWPQRFAAS